MLWHLRNKVDICLVIRVLQIPCKTSDGYFRFLCPSCRDFNSATNPKTNLARCFRCQRNFNPIDLVMADKECSFREAVDYLLSLRHTSDVDIS
jgi:hypothetical protein